MYSINPCKAVNQRIKKTGNCDINEQNELCYGICNSFNNPEGCRDQCKQMITDKKKLLGKSSCSLTRPKPPVKWNQIPYLFPKFFSEMNDVGLAYNKCCLECQNTKYPNTCRELCELGAESIVQPEIVEVEIDEVLDKNQSLTYIFWVILIVLFFVSCGYFIIK